MKLYHVYFSSQDEKYHVLDSGGDSVFSTIYRMDAVDFCEFLNARVQWDQSQIIRTFRV